MDKIASMKIFPDWMLFSVTGFTIVLCALAFVIAVIYMALAVERSASAKKNTTDVKEAPAKEAPAKDEAKKAGDETEPEIIAVVTAAAIAAVGRSNVRRVRVLGPARGAGNWGSIGRLSNQMNKVK